MEEHCAQSAAMTPGMRARIGAQAGKLPAHIEAEPKSRGWNARAKNGAAKTWCKQGFSDW